MKDTRLTRVMLGLGIYAGALAALSVGSWLWLKLNPVRVIEPTPGVSALLTQPIPEGPDADRIRRGRDLVIAADCMSCHTRAGGRPFAGGLGLKTRFGTIYSSNITSDEAQGIGAWTADQFYRVLHEGRAPDGRLLYPAMPYQHFTMISRDQSDAILTFLRSLPPDPHRKPANRLPFPINLRVSMLAWNALNFTPHGFKPSPARSPQWNRGAYLVQGPGHCGACHTPKTLLGAEKDDEALHGSVIEDWFAPDLTGNARTGLGRWRADEIAEYLRTGRNAHSGAVGQMAEVVTYSTSLLPESDREAIATYLKTLPASADAPASPPAPAQMRAGEEIFSDVCTACHLTGGKGQPRLFPPLAGSAVAQQRNPTGVIRLILSGGRTAPTRERPMFQTMPSFAWKLTDQEVADVATYVRNAWGNRASPVSPTAVGKLRSRLRLPRPSRHAFGGVG